MAQEILEAYVDASGKDSTITDKALAISGCVSTPDKWQEFDNQWQDFLKDEDFKPDLKTGRYVFHTSPFWSNACELMPQGLSQRNKQRIYRNLIEIIKEHVVRSSELRPYYVRASACRPIFGATARNSPNRLR